MSSVADPNSANCNRYTKNNPGTEMGTDVHTVETHSTTRHRGLLCDADNASLE